MRPAEDVAHGGVGDGDVFQQRAVHRFQRVTHAAFKDAAGDGDVDESAVRLGAALDASRAAPFAFREPLECAVEHRAQHVVAGDEAVGDGHVLGGARVAQGVAGLGTDAVVPRRVHRAVRHAHVLAAVDVHAVAVGVDPEVVDGQVVHAGRSSPKWPPLRMEKSRSITLWQFLSAMALLPTPGCSAT